MDHFEKQLQLQDEIYKAHAEIGKYINRLKMIKAAMQRINIEQDHKQTVNIISKLWVDTLSRWLDDK